LKTRPVRAPTPSAAPTPRRRYAVNLESDDPALRQRLLREARRNPAVILHFPEAAVPEPEAGETFAARLLPAAALLAAPQRPQGRRARRERGSLLLAFGPAELLPACFLAGCDDYLKEPWTLEELEWRLRRLLPAAARRYRFPWGEFTLRELRIVRARGSGPLSFPELSILRLLAEQQGQLVPREALYCALWGKAASGGSRVVDVHVSRLRRKLLALFPDSAGALRAVRNQGYLLR